MNPGALDHLAAFQSPVRDRDADGQLHHGWRDEFKVWAGVLHLRGGEAVMQARLASRSPAILTIRNSADARRVTSEWRAIVRERTGEAREYALKEDPRPTEGNAVLEMLVEAG